MTISARNKIQGRVTIIQAGEVMSLVTVQAADHKLVSAVTNEGVKELQLKQNDTITAVVKSTEVMLIKGDSEHLKISARNRLKGQVEMALAQGDQVNVVIKATEVMLLK